MKEKSSRSPNKPIRVLAVHGVGFHEVGGKWEKDWEEAIKQSIGKIDPDAAVEVEYVYLKEIFEKYSLSFWDTIVASIKLTGSALGTPFRRSIGRGGVGELGSAIRWTAGMVVQWVENKDLRLETRKKLIEGIRKHAPDVVVAHSLGSLVCYDTFGPGGDGELIKDRVFVSFGSQINNPFVVGNFSAGRIRELEKARHWYHLYNKHDSIFTSEIRIHASNFQQVNTTFDLSGMADHSAVSYLSHDRTIETLWSDVMIARRNLEMVYPGVDKVVARLRSSSDPILRELVPQKHRALIVGIDDYPDVQMRLRGCTNDAYLMSSFLQEQGIEAESIRLLLNHRATCEGILERLEWLLDGVKEGDTRVFVFSGHGARIPYYGIGETIDSLDECLVPYDFDWSLEKALIDDRFYELYSQLPYGVQFIVILDCCHSSGMTRSGSGVVRGLTPPEDVFHRAIRWVADEEEWGSRTEFAPNNLSAAINLRRKRAKADARSVSSRLGEAMPLRSLDRKDFRTRREEMGHEGPYFPLLVYACEEDEYAYETQVGSQHFGAFTHSLVKTFKNLEKQKSQKTIEQFEVMLQNAMGDRAQTPRIFGPEAVKSGPVPFLGKLKK